MIFYVKYYRNSNIIKKKLDEYLEIVNNKKHFCILNYQKHKFINLNNYLSVVSSIFILTN